MCELAHHRTSLRIEERVYPATLRRLGGTKFWIRRPQDRVDAAAQLAAAEGCLRYGSLASLLSQLRHLKKGEVARALCVSASTLAKGMKTPEKIVHAQLARKAWRLAEMLAMADEVFGSDEGEAWMSCFVMGLDGRRPVELLRSAQGTQLVTDFLGRLDSCVYT